MVAGIVLAGGESSRMGSPKALLAAGGGVSFLGRIVRVLGEAGVAPVVVVTGAHHDAIAAHVRDEQLPVTLVRNPDPRRGQLSSLLCGLETLGPEAQAVIVAPVDAPFAAPATVERLVEEFRRDAAPVIRPAREGGRHGHPVLFARSVFDALRAADPALGAKAVVRGVGDRVANVIVDDEGAFVDVDTPEDLERIRALLRLEV
jgi:CTP:molybdopterin cytidylyltransferase MocA